MSQRTDALELTENKSIDIIYKISPVSYIKDILAGCLYMNPLSYFRTLEIDGKGDDKEGLLCENAKGKAFVTLNGKQELIATIDNISAWVNDHNPIFCFSHTTLECTKEGIYTFQIPSRMFSEFVSTDSEPSGLIIINRKAFEQRLSDILPTHTYIFKEVEYTDIQGFNETPAFHKRYLFSHQKEIRLLLSNEKLNKNEHYRLELGNIEDMSRAFQFPLHIPHNASPEISLRLSPNDRLTPAERMPS